MPNLAYGHRARAPYLDQDQIPSLSAGILKAQQYGNDWFVNSAATAGGNGATPSGAFTTLAAALAVALSGDRVYLAPSHAETISAAGGITWSQSGIAVIGLGQGAVRPTFTFSATAATFVISGANNLLSNVRVKTSIDELVLMFSVTGDGNVLDRVDFVETASAQALSFATITGDDVVMTNCYHVQAVAPATAQSWITLTGADRIRIVGNVFLLTLSDFAGSGVIRTLTTECVNVVIASNLVRMTGFSAALVNAFNGAAGTTGLVADNRIGCNAALNTTVNNLPGCYSFNTLVTNVADTSGILDPIADT